MAMDAQTKLAQRLLSSQDSALSARFRPDGFSLAKTDSAQKDATGYTKLQLGDGSYEYAQLGSNARLDEGSIVFVSGRTGVSRAANAGGRAL